MINSQEILQTLRMIDQQHLDVRTITMGISLLDCCDPDPAAACRKIYDKITTSAEHLVQTGHDIETEFGIPIVNKRISVTPMALVAGASRTNDYVPFAQAMDKAAKAVGEKSIAMLPQKELLPLTGYVHGGCSPVGMKKQFPTVFHETVNELDLIAVSAGKIGHQVQVKPADLLNLLRAKTADVIV